VIDIDVMVDEKNCVKVDVIDENSATIDDKHEKFPQVKWMKILVMKMVNKRFKMEMSNVLIKPPSNIIEKFEVINKEVQ